MVLGVILHNPSIHIFVIANIRKYRSLISNMHCNIHFSSGNLTYSPQIGRNQSLAPTSNVKETLKTLFSDKVNSKVVMDLVTSLIICQYKCYILIYQTK